MNQDDIKRIVLDALQPALSAITEHLNQQLETRLQLLQQQLLERHIRQVNVNAWYDARITAIGAAVTGHDAQQAFRACQDEFRLAHPGEFDPEVWGVEPEWLAALRRQ